LRFAEKHHQPYTQTEFVFVHRDALRRSHLNKSLSPERRNSIKSAISGARQNCCVATARSPNGSTDREILYVRRILQHMMEYARAARKRANADIQWASRALTVLSRLVKESAIVLLALIAINTTAQAEPRCSEQRNKNYILRRQQVYPGIGVPTSRLIIGKREVDIYRNGMMFERDHLIGVRSDEHSTHDTKTAQP
jgi:hypothetical protein